MTDEGFHHASAAAGYFTSQNHDCTANWTLDIPIKFVAAEAGFLPPGPLTLLADIVRGGE